MQLSQNVCDSHVENVFTINKLRFYCQKCTYIFMFKMYLHLISLIRYFLRLNVRHHEKLKTKVTFN